MNVTQKAKGKKKQKIVVFEMIAGAWYFLKSYCRIVSGRASWDICHHLAAGLVSDKINFCYTFSACEEVPPNWESILLQLG